MKREEVINGLRFLANSVESDEDSEIFNTAIQSIEKLEKIKQIINDPLVKAFGSIGTNKIREILGEEDKPCQMQ